VRELSDEQFILWMNCEEFSSKPVFNQQLVKLATAGKSGASGHSQRKTLKAIA
jgi:hypothetical protein